MKPHFTLALSLLAALSLSACAPSQPEIDVGALHDRVLTLDTHIDIPLTYMTEIDPSRETDLQVDLPKLTAGKLDSGFWIVYTPQGDLDAGGYELASDIANTRVKAIAALVSVHSENFELARSASDVRRIVSEGRRAVMIGMENAYPLGQDNYLEELAKYADAGVRYVGITHFGHNQFGDSSNPNFVRDSGPKWNGLSPAGIELVDALNDAGILVDLSHAGKETMMQAADLSRTPIIASHSGVKAVADSARNLDDEQLRKLAEVNGVAQMVALGALGSYVKLPTAEQQAARDKLDAEFGDRSTWDQAKRDLYGERLASDFDGGGGIDGWQDASETLEVTRELVARGYSEGGNLLRVMEAVEAEAAR